MNGVVKDAIDANGEKCFSINEDQAILAANDKFSDVDDAQTDKVSIIIYYYYYYYYLFIIISVDQNNCSCRCSAKSINCIGGDLRQRFIIFLI